MKITVNGQELDLYQYPDASINFTVQVSTDLNQRLVPSTPTIKIPKTETNKGILDPILETTNKILNTVVTFENGMSQLMTMYVNTSSMYKFGNEYSVKLVSILADNINEIGEDLIGEIFTDSDDWAYMFLDNGLSGQPLVDPNGEWFIAAPNRNGQDYTDDHYPIYTERYISEETGDLYIGMSVYSFMKRVFDKYVLPIGFSSDEQIVSGASVSDVKIFFPVKLKTKDDRSMGFDISTDDNGVVHFSNLQDYAEQLAMQEDKVTATTDTFYDIKTSSPDGSTTTFTIEHYNTLDQYAPDSVSGKIHVQLLVLKDDAIVKAIDMALFDFDNGDAYDSTGKITKPINTDYLYRNVVQNLKFLATSELTFKIVVRFDEYSFTDCCNGDCENGSQTITWNHTTTEFPKMIGTYFDCYDTDGNQVNYTFNMLASGNIHVNMTATENISACSRVTDGVTVIETVSMVDTMNYTEIKIKDVINEILKRFNAGFYMKHDGTIGFATFANRYDSDLKIKIPVWEDGYDINYLDNTLGIFSYTNHVIKVTDKFFKTRKDETHMLGDVINQNFGGDKDERINLSSSLVFADMYSENYYELTSNDFEMLELTDKNGDGYTREFFGIPYNKKAGERVGDILFGFVGDIAQDWILMPIVIMFQRDPADDTTNLPTVAYVKDSLYGSKTMSGTEMKLVKPSHLLNNIDYLTLGDEIKHEVDETKPLYKNFIPVLKPKGDYVELNTLMDAETIETILAGAKIVLIYPNAAEETYYPLDVKGLMLEQYKSVISIKMVKENE